MIAYMNKFKNLKRANVQIGELIEICQVPKLNFMYIILLGS